MSDESDDAFVTEPWPHRRHGELGGPDASGDALPAVEHDQQDSERVHTDVTDRARSLRQPGWNSLDLCSEQGMTNKYSFVNRSP